MYVCVFVYVLVYNDIFVCEGEERHPIKDMSSQVSEFDVGINLNGDVDEIFEFNWTFCHRDWIDW